MADKPQVINVFGCGSEPGEPELCPLDQLSLVWGIVQSIEVDVDSLPGGAEGYFIYLEKAAKKFIESGHQRRVTVHSVHRDSINLGKKTRSVFLGISGSDAYLNILLEDLRAAEGVLVLLSDLVDSMLCRRELHIEDGVALRPYDDETWEVIHFE